MQQALVGFELRAGEQPTSAAHHNWRGLPIWFVFPIIAHIVAAGHGAVKDAPRGPVEASGESSLNAAADALIRGRPTPLAESQLRSFLDAGPEDPG